MRLLNTQTQQLEEFVGEVGAGIPPYAILSHTWGDEEVSLQDLTSGTAASRRGHGKILGACAVTAAEGFAHVWIDTCCIDKTSSAELSEAINSMFAWYGAAALCYAYLSDVADAAEDPHADRSAFARSRWFARGWTLQELLAPGEVVFLAADWAEIGTKKSLRAAVARASGIREDVLRERRWRDYSVAEKMSWAAGRQTTRVEDEAYCLMGLFDINMPLLYGEGRKSFFRLQQEILRQSDDETIFAWSHPKEQCSHVQLSGLLAPSPKSFRDSAEIRRIERSYDVENPIDMTAEYQSPFEIVNQLVRMRVPILGPIAAVQLGPGPALSDVVEIVDFQLTTLTAAPKPLRLLYTPALTLTLPDDDGAEAIHQLSSPPATIPSGREADFAAISYVWGTPETSPNWKRGPAIPATQRVRFKDLEGCYVRSFTYEPIMIAILRCQIQDSPIGILLSRGPTRAAGKGILSRLHYPSLVSLKEVLRHFSNEPASKTVYVTSSTNDGGQPKAADHSGDFEIRIGSLLSQGYLLHDAYGPGWIFLPLTGLLIPNRKHFHMAQVVSSVFLFYHESLDDQAHPTFFISIANFQASAFEVGVYQPSKTGASPFYESYVPVSDYALYSEDLENKTRIDVPMNESNVIAAKLRDINPGRKFIHLSIEPKRSRANTPALLPYVLSRRVYEARLFPPMREIHASRVLQRRGERHLDDPLDIDAVETQVRAQAGSC